MLKPSRRRTVASLILGAWLFGLFIGIAHACGLDGVMAMSGDAVAARTVDDSSPSGAKFCIDDLPLVAEIQAVQDPPNGQPLLLALPHDIDPGPGSVPVFGPASTARTPRVALLPLRFVRLTL